jgi:phenylalanyl-tRNA synthetase beta chain
VWSSRAFGVELTLARAGAGGASGMAGGRGADRELASALPPESRGAPGGPRPVRYRPLPATPASEFDLALIVPDERSAADVEAVVRREAGELLERLTLFDEFRGAGVPAGARSLAWRLTFRHPERTLRDKEIDGRRQKLVRTLESELGVRTRS